MPSQLPKTYRCIVFAYGLHPGLPRCFRHPTPIFRTLVQIRSELPISAQILVMREHWRGDSKIRAMVALGMENATQSASPPQPPRHAPQPLHFNGNGAEYFGIWIVNLLLTIVTLGIYSAWAKVRRLQYFYRHTELAGSSFDFHGSPIRILIGRLIALAMLIAYNVSVRLQSRMIIVVVLALAVVMPWLLRNSFRFRLYNTSWRGTRFHFRGSVGGSYRVLLLNGFLTLITLYMMAPFMHQRLKQYQHENSWLGRTQCSFHARASQFYAIYLLLLVAMVGFFFLISVAGVGHAFITVAQMQKQGGHVDQNLLIRTFVILYGALILIGLVVGPIFHALVTNLIGAIRASGSIASNAGCHRSG